ncbi:MAG: protein kinase [Gemmatimonadota bacterium]
MADATDRFGKFEIRETLGQGGFGRVYRAYDTVLQREVAIKVFTVHDPSIKQRFLREAQIAASLSHPNIVAIFDLGEHDGDPFIVQEYLAGEDLETIIRRRDAISLLTKLNYLIGIADGIAFAHRHGVIHRDIKPQNVRILTDGSVRVLDFGIAKRAVEDATALTQPGSSVGTAGYMAPEQLRGEQIDHRVDIFSFGALAFRLLTLRRAFEGDSLASTLFKIVHEEAVWPSGVRETYPPDLTECIDRCLAKKAEDRPSSCKEIVAALRDVKRSVGSGAEAAAMVTGQAAGADPDQQATRLAPARAAAYIPPTAPFNPPAAVGPRQPRQAAWWNAAVGKRSGAAAAAFIIIATAAMASQSLSGRAAITNPDAAVTDATDSADGVAAPGPSDSADLGGSAGAPAAATDASAEEPDNVPNQPTAPTRDTAAPDPAEQPTNERSAAFALLVDVASLDGGLQKGLAAALRGDDRIDLTATGSSADLVISHQGAGSMLQVRGSDGTLRGAVSSADPVRAAESLAGTIRHELGVMGLMRLQNPAQSFAVTIALVGGRRTFRVGDAIEFTVRTQRPGYLTLVDIGPTGQVFVLYPNPDMRLGELPAASDIRVPSGAHPGWVVAPPVGRGAVRAIVTSSPLFTEGSQPGSAAAAAHIHEQLAASAGSSWATALVTYSMTDR